MEIFLLLVVILFVIMIYNKQSHVDLNINQLRKEIYSLKKSEINYSAVPEPIVEKPVVVKEIFTSAPVAEQTISPIPEPIVTNLEEESISATEEIMEETQEVSVITEVPVVPVVTETPIQQVPPSYFSRTEEWEEFKRKAVEHLNATIIPTKNNETPVNKIVPENTDIEKFIGENLINKIGIAVLILGISFLVKYAIDNNWIKESGRVLVGFICGLILAGFAHKLRDKFRSFSSVLVAGSLTVFYFTTAFAFHQYHMWPQSLTFAVMVAITALAVTLSLAYNRMELIIMATIGGFITPFLVSNGSGNYIALFTYLIILNVGLVVIAYYKEWRIVQFISFVFTEIIFCSWLINYSGISGFHYKGALVFASIFYALFFTVNIILQSTRSEDRKPFDYIVLLSQNLIYYSSGIYILDQTHHSHYKGLFTAILGVVHLILTLIFSKNKKLGKLYTILLTGITLTYFTLAVPVQFQSQYITIFWGMEMLILFYLYQRSFETILKIASLILGVLMLLSYFYNWITVYGDEYGLSYKIIVNKAFLTGLFCSAILWVYFKQLYKEANHYFFPGFTTELLRIFTSLFAVLIMFIAGFAEVSHQFSNHFCDISLNLIYELIFSFSFVYALFFGFKKQLFWLNNTITIVIIAGAVLCYLFQTQSVYNTFIKIMYSHGLQLHYIALIIADALVIFIVWKLVNRLRSSIFESNDDHVFTYIIMGISTILFSIIGQHIFIQIYHCSFNRLAYAENLYQKAGITVLWSIISFIVIRYGIKNNYKPMRVSALALFALSIVKLFIYDISDVPPAGKIIAFILLGVVLLVVSFMYQKIKAIVLKEEGEKES